MLKRIEIRDRNPFPGAYQLRLITVSKFSKAITKVTVKFLVRKVKNENKRFKNHKGGAREMYLCLRGLAALAGDLSSVPSTHISGLTTTCNSRSRGPTSLFQHL